jgi:hypothetical protein
MKKLMLTLAISMMFAPAAFAANPAADAPAAKAGAMPAYGKDKPIPTPKIVKKTLANGMTVWVVPRKGLPRVDYVLAVRGAGFAADDSAHPGFANLLAGMINEGSAKRSPKPPRAWAARWRQAPHPTASPCRPMPSPRRQAR